MFQSDAIKFNIPLNGPLKIVIMSYIGSFTYNKYCSCINSVVFTTRQSVKLHPASAEQKDSLRTTSTAAVSAVLCLQDNLKSSIHLQQNKRIVYVPKVLQLYQQCCVYKIARQSPSLFSRTRGQFTYLKYCSRIKSVASMTRQPVKLHPSSAEQNDRLRSKSTAAVSAMLCLQ